MPRNRRFATVEKSYITDIERERCKKVAAAYAELYELESILVLDVGRYGFVKLQYYTPEYGFNDVTLTAHLTYRTCHNGFGGFTVTVDFSLRPRFVLVITVNIAGMVFYFYYNNVPVAHYK